jgi:hypothetical protein
MLVLQEEVMWSPMSNDALIMEEIRQQLSIQDLKLFNRCLIYLQALWMSDITTADGQEINWYACQGRPNGTQTPYISWPVQGQPNAEAWEVWGRGMQILGKQKRGGAIVVHHSLGEWMTRGKGDWFFDTSSERLLHSKTGTIYRRQKGRATRNSTMLFKASNIRDTTFRQDSIASVITLANNTVRLEGVGRYVAEGEKRGNSFHEFVQQQTRWQWWSGQLEYNEHEIRQIADDIQEGKGVAVSNGSYKDVHGTAAAVLEGRKSGMRINTSVAVPGTANMQCAYRSEAAGSLAAVQMTEAVVLFCNKTQGKCIMGCDGQAALRQCFYQCTGFQVNAAHYDIIGEVRQEIKRSRLKWEQNHIPGHQTICQIPTVACWHTESSHAC